MTTARPGRLFSIGERALRRMGLAGPSSPAAIDPELLVRLLYRGVLGREADAEGLRLYTAQLEAGVPAEEIVRAFVTSTEFTGDAGGDDAVRLYVPPGHYYSPVPPMAEVRAHLERQRATGTPRELPDVRLDLPAMKALWHELVPLMRDAPFAETATEGLRYRFDNPSYSWGDGLVLHAMLRRFKPRRLIEIGSGWSSACTLDTVERYLDGACRLTFIEPYPELVRSLFGADAARFEILETPVQAVPVTTFDQLEAGDVLFIDSTHVLRTGSDVAFELFEVLPRLRSGVLVHIHDMFWPFEYPEQWSLDEGRGWNELYAVRAFLAGNSDWDIVMFNDCLKWLEEPLIEATCPDFLRNAGGALWLRRR
jgi:hypothetical protein